MEPSLDATLPTWARLSVYIFGATVGACALAASGVDLYGLAVALGFARATSLAVPIGLDAGATTVGVLWITAPAASAQRRQWRAATLALVGASAVLNGLSVLAGPHWLAAAPERGLADVGLLTGGVAVVIAVVIASAFPLVAAWMVHAILVVRDDAARHSTALGSSAPSSPPAVPVVPPVREEHQEPMQEPDSEQQEAVPDPWAERDNQAVEENAPPELTGHKLADARAWFRHQREHGRTPLPVEINRWIDSDGYVKTRHVDQWERELRDEAGQLHELDEHRRLADVR